MTSPAPSDPVNSQPLGDVAASTDQPGFAPQDHNTPFNTLAIVAFVSSFFVSVAGIVCGHIALAQLKRQPARGRGFAIAGTIIGYVGFVCTVAWLVLVLVVVNNSVLGNVNSSERDNTPSVGEYSEQDAVDTPDPDDLDDFASDGTGAGASSGEAVCDAIDELLETSFEAEHLEPEALGALRVLSQSESANAATYAAVLELLDSGDSAQSDRPELADEFTLALTDDYVMCTAYGDDVL